MPTGTVKWFNERKGYGFIKMDDGVDIFVHKSNLKDTGFRRTLQENQRVSFEIRKGPKGDEAIEVRVI
ncbi:MAG: cold shock domain-containing protein [candidate division KSB1 bacterium]|nr:cold shock domain-containing protein [candidate division KSB1 bacterium]